MARHRPDGGKTLQHQPVCLLREQSGKIIDPDGRSYSEFDENGNYLRTIKNNWWHNFLHGRTGRIVDGVAHNHMNFGNFLFGAAGKALGLTLFELQMGAHYNSLANPDKNGYKRQLDSSDDQFSIRMGVKHANKHNYKRMYYKVVVGELSK